MLYELYILFTIIAFLCFFLSLYLNKGMSNIFTWPLSLVLFCSLFFSSYNIVKYTADGIPIVLQEAAFSWIFIGMAGLSFILFAWDIFDKYLSGGFSK